MAFRIILKQFQNKCERFKQTSQPVSQREREWASQLIKVIRKMGNVSLLLASEYAFGQQLANCVNWKTNENETKTDETFFFHSSSLRMEQKQAREWIERQGATARTISTFYFIAILVAKLDGRKVVRFSSFYVITLRLSLFLRFF